MVGDDPGGPKRHVTAVTDAGLRAFTVVYYTRADAKKPQVRGKIRRITDHSGHALDFDYYQDGNLLRITQRGGTNADGTFLADRSFVFTYTDDTGEAPAIANLGDRLDPDPKTPSQSTHLYSVRDPRQVAAGTAGVETTFTYFGPSAGPELRWRLKDRTNRLGNKTSFAYAPVAQTTTVTAPMSRATSYAYDTDGKVTQITNPLGQTTGVAWTADFKVSKLTEPTGVFTDYEYNDNGYLTKIIEPTVTNGQRDTTVLGYRDDPVDTADTARHLSLLTSRTNPKGVATPPVPGVPDDFQWTFGYDLVGRLASVTDPENNTSTNAWNPDGTLASTTDANLHTTTYNTYDPSGLPTRITDAKGQVTQASYDPDGLLLWLQDPLHASDSGSDTRSYQRQFDYDSFRRLGRQSVPKSTRYDRGQLIWTSAAYDPGDNRVKQVGARYGASDPGVGPTSTFTYDDMDQPTLAANPQDEQTKVKYDDAGRPIQVTSPKGVATSGPANLDKDFATLCVLAAAAFIPVGKGARGAELALQAAKEARVGGKALMLRKLLWGDSHGLGNYRKTRLQGLFGNLGKAHEAIIVGGHKRVVDYLVGGIAHESKAGYVSLDRNVREQIAKDVELLQSGQVQAVVWHFWDTPSKPLLEELTAKGIYPVIHP